MNTYHAKLRLIQLESRNLRDELIKYPYAFPGGYPRFAVTNDGAAICHDCCKKQSECIGFTSGNDGWRLVGLEINWEDPQLYCDNCSVRIESAYADSNDDTCELDLGA